MSSSGSRAATLELLFIYGQVDNIRPEDMEND